jgi:hypothetical protein
MPRAPFNHAKSVSFWCCQFLHFLIGRRRTKLYSDIQIAARLIVSSDLAAKDIDPLDGQGFGPFSDDVGQSFQTTVSRHVNAL